MPVPLAVLVDEQFAIVHVCESAKVVRPAVQSAAAGGTSMLAWALNHFELEGVEYSNSNSMLAINIFRRNNSICTPFNV